MSSARVVVRPTETIALREANEYIEGMTKAMNDILKNPSESIINDIKLLMLADGFSEIPTITFAASDALESLRGKLSSIAQEAKDQP